MATTAKKNDQVSRAEVNYLKLALGELVLLIKHEKINVHHLNAPSTNLLTLRALLPPSGWSSM
jgi:hypothetical protein